MNNIPFTPLPLLKDILEKLGVADITWAYSVASFFCIWICAWLGLIIARFVIDGKLTRLVLKSRMQWDDELHKNGFFRRCSHIVPGVTVYLVTPLLLDASTAVHAVLMKGSTLYLLLVFLTASSAVLNTVESVYNASKLAHRAPITGFIQVAKLLLVVVVLLLSVASLIDKSPLLLLSGLGAVTAVLLLVFRDAILGFVAGIQIAANRMVNTGDWIEMPKFGADGNVLEVGLTTVKVQNFDHTISTIPTYNLITDAVKNWRGMSESDGRRIKRAIHIDIQSIRFLSEQDIQSLQSQRLIGQYINSKKSELSSYHQANEIDGNDPINARRLTNVGTFRAYMQAYLESHPSINKDLTLMVRQLPPTELGLPLEIYCFSQEKDWTVYEGIQGDIIDHMLATLPLFDLRVYQRVSDK